MWYFTDTVEKANYQWFSGGRIKGMDHKRTRKSFGAGKILYLDCYRFTTLYALVKNQQKKGQILLCKLCLSKLDIMKN